MNARRNGFTLMETLVMLVLVSFAVLLMFQMLGSYRLARERVLAHAGGIDRQLLFEDWFRDSVHGLRPDVPGGFTGSSLAFAGTTLNPMFASGGAPVAMRWRLEQDDGGWQVHYEEGGQERFALPLEDGGAPHFAYFDDAGEMHADWPPGLGLQRALPAGVALVRTSAEGGKAIFAAVPGPLDPYYAPYQLEEE